MALSKGFENKDSKSEKAEGGKHAGGPTFDVLQLLGMPSAKEIEKSVKSTVEQAVDGLKNLVGQAEKHEHAATDKHPNFPPGSLLKAANTHHDFPRGTYLKAHTQNHDHPLMGRLVHNETRGETPHPNPSHLSAFLLRRLRENSNQAQQLDQQPMQFEQQFNQQIAQQPAPFEQQETQGNQWQEAKYNIKHAASETLLETVAKPLASIAPGADLNPNLGADENQLRQMGVPMARSVFRDKERLDQVIHGVATGHAEKFQSQIQHFQGGGPFHAYSQRHSNISEHNYYQQSHQQPLPYGGFQSHISYYRRSS